MKLADYTPFFVDFETFTDKNNGYCLKRGGAGMSMCEYVRDERFKAHLVAWTDRPNWCGWSADTKAALTSSIPWSKVAIVAHNAKFDGSILAWRYGVVPGLYIDTVSLAKAVIGGRVAGHGLKELAEYMGLPAKGDIAMKYDGIRDLAPEQEAELAAYCRNDVQLCRAIYEKLMPQFPEGQLEHLDWTIRTYIQPKLVLDIPTLEKGLEDEKSKRDEAIRNSGLSLDVLSSNKQFAEHLVTRGIEVPTKLSKRTGKQAPALSVSDPGFIALAATDGRLHAGRVAAKSTIRSTRGQALVNVAKTGPFPFDVQFSGAVQTHRYSGGGGAGGNPQNFPRKGFIRDAVSAPQGSALVVGDFSNIELRILAWLAQEPKLINAIVNGTDVYSEFASLVYKRPINKHDNPTERQFGKCAILGLGYGMGPKRFQQMVLIQTGQSVTDQMAKETVYMYRNVYPKVKQLWNTADMALRWISEASVRCLLFAPFVKVEKDALVLPSGLKLQYPHLRRSGKEWVYDSYEKKSATEEAKIYGGKLVENICQALAGEINKEAILRCRQNHLQVVGSVHDEIICIDVQETAARVASALETIMSQSVSWWPQLRLNCEVGYGQTWTTAKA